MRGRKTTVRRSDKGEWAVISLKPLLPLAIQRLCDYQNAVIAGSEDPRQLIMQKAMFIAMVLG